MLTLTKNLLPTNHYLSFLYISPPPVNFLMNHVCPVLCSMVCGKPMLVDFAKMQKGCQLLKLLADMSMLGLLIVDLTDQIH